MRKIKEQEKQVARKIVWTYLDVNVGGKRTLTLRDAEGVKFTKTGWNAWVKV